MNVMRKIIQLISKLFSWLSNLMKGNRRSALIVGILSFLGLGGEGARRYNKSRKINKEAESIRNAAIKKRDAAFQNAESSLENLGRLKISVAESFEEYDAVIARIINLPKTKIPILSEALLPHLDTKEYKKISDGVRIAVDAAAGASAGTLVGIAMTGLGAVALAPGLFLSGAVVFAKGSSLEKKAYAKVKQAKEVDKEADKLVEYYSRLLNLTDELADGIGKVLQMFLSHLHGIRILVDANPSWKSYSKAEQKTITNTAKLAYILKDLCEVVPTTRTEKEDTQSPLNEKGVKQALKEVDKQLKSYAESI